MISVSNIPNLNATSVICKFLTLTDSSNHLLDLQVWEEAPCLIGDAISYTT